MDNPFNMRTRDAALAVFEATTEAIAIDAREGRDDRTVWLHNEQARAKCRLRELDETAGT